MENCENCMADADPAPNIRTLVRTSSKGAEGDYKIFGNIVTDTLEEYKTYKNMFDEVLVEAREVKTRPSTKQLQKWVSTLNELLRRLQVSFSSGLKPTLQFLCVCVHDLERRQQRSYRGHAADAGDRRTIS
jgi:hypothetical protein